MSGDLTARDDLVQQLAEVISDAIAAGAGESHNPVNAVARAVLASGLVVPHSDILNLAQQWESEHRSGLDALMTGSDQYAAELRALTQQEPR